MWKGFLGTFAAPWAVFDAFAFEFDMPAQNQP